MDDTRLNALISQVRARLEAVPPAPPPGNETCLMFARARSLALDPEQWTAEERQHAGSCRRCRHLVESFQREIGHLSYWTLLRVTLGATTAWEQHEVKAHLETAGCRYCRRRKDALARRSPLRLYFPHVPALRNPAVLLAAPSEPLVLAHAEHADLEAELIDDHDELALEVRTKNPALNHMVVGYALLGKGGELIFEGFLVLAQDVEGWYTGQAALHQEALLESSVGSGGILEVSVPELELLGEREALLLQANAIQDEAGQRAWRAWAEQTATDFAGSATPIAATLREILTALRARD